ncbi:MAG TPA: hypothetical protein VFF81_12085 [Noviherbaspirillum sp.]|nr:hypothetical protein [Noviherbaspirillum sp.]
MYCAAVEVTEQVLAERYRAEENERLRSLFEQARRRAPVRIKAARSAQARASAHLAGN